jgi:hypothetical protein
MAQQKTQGKCKVHEKVKDEAKCPEDAVAHDLCARHYNQERRGKLGKTREIAAKGKGMHANITIRCDKAIKAAVKRLAKEEKVEPADLWREGIDLVMRLRERRKAATETKAA